ncbi:MAG: hypothetical protein K1060chlam4_00250 [Candidatus Anoxychlamydiales bacterium]|nr:hypothetical protein [Candidatus Anoxychlamydiales bacterium]
MSNHVDLLNSSSQRRIDHVVEKHSFNSRELDVSKFSTSDRNEIQNIIIEALDNNANIRQFDNGRVVREVKMNRIIGTTVSSIETDSIRIISGIGNEILITAFPIDSIGKTNLVVSNFFKARF